MASEADVSGLLIEHAKEDLRASKLLYENRIYSKAILHLALAVEISLKALEAATEGIASWDGIKKMGHRPWLHVIRAGCGVLLDGYNRIKSDEIVAGFLNKLSFDLFQLAKSVELCSDLMGGKNYEELVKQMLLCSLSSECVGKTIDRLRELERELEKTAEIDDQQLITGLGEAMNRMLEALGEVLGQRFSVARESIELLRRKLSGSMELITIVAKPFIKLLTKISYSGVVLLELSMLLSPHINTTRYPDKVGDIELSPSSYKEDMPLVKMLGELIEIAEKAICSLEEVLAIIYRKTRLGDMLENTTRNP